MATNEKVSISQILDGDLENTPEDSIAPAEEDAGSGEDSRKKGNRGTGQPIPIVVSGVGFACPYTNKTYKKLGVRLVKHMIKNMPKDVTPVEEWQPYELDGVWYCPFTGKEYKSAGKRLSNQVEKARQDIAALVG